MKILAIETSCDETSVAILEADDLESIKVLSHKTLSQIALHKEYGGVFPTLAKRAHGENLVPLFLECLKEANLPISPTDSLSPESHQKIEEILEKNQDLAKGFFEKFACT